MRLLQMLGGETSLPPYCAKHRRLSTVQDALQGLNREGLKARLLLPMDDGLA